MIGIMTNYESPESNIICSRFFPICNNCILYEECHAMNYFYSKEENEKLAKIFYSKAAKILNAEKKKEIKLETININDATGYKIKRILEKNKMEIVCINCGCDILINSISSFKAAGKKCSNCGTKLNFNK